MFEIRFFFSIHFGYGKFVSVSIWQNKIIIESFKKSIKSKKNKMKVIYINVVKQNATIL
jgi:hypothetical protein